MNLVVGIDIGGTKTKIGLVDVNGKCVDDLFFRTRDYIDLDDYLDKISDSVSELKIRSKKPVNIIGCGIGAPNASSKNGTIENAANLVWKGKLPIVKKLQQRLDLPMQIMNDASAAALGEMLFGNAKSMDNFIVISLGTGLGAGIVINGELVDGFDGFAGELGHVNMNISDGRYTGLGVEAGLEAYVSSTGLKRTILFMLSKYTVESRFRSIAFNDLHGEEITKAAEEGDIIALKAFDYTAKILAMALANFTCFSQPQAFFILGGLVNSGKWIQEPLEKYFNENLLTVYKGKVQLLKSGLQGKNPAICGAASLIWKNYQ